MAQQAVNSLKKKAFGVVTTLAIILSANAVHTQEIGGKCVTPDSLEGECVVVRNCKYFLDKLKPPLTKDEIDSLRRSQCGFQGNQPYVCCPKEITSTATPISINEHPNARLLPVDACGYGEENAIFTDVANLNQFPWLALLGYEGSGNGTRFRCGGVIVNEKYILTAAHCITDLPDDLKLTSVRLGEHNLVSSTDCEGENDFKICLPPAQDMEIEELIPYPEFDKKLIQNDIGLIRLKMAINISRESNTPICLPLNEKDINPSGPKMEIAGWGITKEGETSSELRKVTVDNVESGACAEKYKKFVNIYANRQLCVSPEYNSHRTCIGDSGGPLMGRSERGRRFVRGIMSFGLAVCRTSDYPRVYTLVDYYMRWILDNLKP